jgi:zinc transporter ZupT
MFDYRARFGAIFVSLIIFYWIFSDTADSSVPLTQKQRAEERQDRTKRIALLILAITIHNIPEGLAVGVGFATDNFQNARNLAIGIGIQVSI